MSLPNSQGLPRVTDPEPVGLPLSQVPAGALLRELPVARVQRAAPQGAQGPRSFVKQHLTVLVGPDSTLQGGVC